MADNVDTISRVTGMPRQELLSLWDEVQRNHTRLRTCQRHDFGPLTPGAKPSTRYECRNCGGWADSTAIYWYQIGLEHGLITYNP
ncbi:MAG: hypothetical protein Q7U48_13815 [Hydrogenophaga sp.]|nr:hypothetical protein [Hydrogenophaga sp.]